MDDVVIPTGAALTPPRALRHRDRQVSTYTELARRVREAGLMSRRRGYYWPRMAAAALALGAVATGVVLVGHSWWVLLLAAALALVVTQCAFLGHDGAHRQIFASPRANEWAGRVFASLVAGLSYGWWTGKHTRHHQAPNQLGVDGDVEPGALSFTVEAAESRRGALRWLTRHQGWLFFPLLLLEGVNLHVASATRLLRGRSVRGRWVDVAMIAGHWGAYLSVLLLLLSPGKAAAFLAVHLAVFGVSMGGAFAPNHVGMPVVARGAKVDFLRRQVLMSRNVRGGALVRTVMGGLELQVEHHLFPSMPRPNLRRAQPLVRAYCAEQGVLYTETTLWGAYRAVVTHLDRVGLAARGATTCPLAAQLR
ncbi:acyl-CoA desaturase [Pseudokineococcus marinus]|uniref:Acyl-CoA desaturase n=1 Tax=Pseudokineococcus marinus TaxID=351215 RepID=A0A849BL12_9ACTN|nr:acyl-CoA desaturase [Pseudokineococcus marinus]NNH21492.1 acyl-CoA desaturase [Pseudokineococcus marinus]